MGLWSSISRRFSPRRAPRPLSEFYPPQYYPGYSSRDLEVFDRFIASPSASQPGFITDFLGVRTRMTTLPDSESGRDGDVVGLPVPEDTFHAETIEYIGLLKGVAAAHDAFVALELGAGWGPWLVGGAFAAQRLGITDVRLYGVESDREHYAFMRQHFADNGLDADEHTLLHAAVGAERSTARWPETSLSANNSWGTSPILQSADADSGSEEGSDAAPQDDQVIDVLSIAELLQQEDRWDFVHMDIQGWEGDVCRAGLSLLTARAKYVVVGTHSRALDGEVLQLFWKAGWILENEKPAQFRFATGKQELQDMTLMDGTQVWLNPTI